MFKRSLKKLSLSLLAALAVGVHATAAPLPSLAEAMAAKRDLWGEAAMAQPNGASYEFFAPLLPPLRYVNADFHHYPIVLSAPHAKLKARLISNGSGINLRGGARSWNDNGVPVTFRVGPDELVFGTLPERVSEPVLAEGYLPIAEIRYLHRSPLSSEVSGSLRAARVDREAEIYRLEAFASTDPTLAEHGVVFVQLSLAQGMSGFISVEVAAKSALRFAEGKITNDNGDVLAWFDPAWKWERNGARARLTGRTAVTLAIATMPLPAAALPATVVSAAIYDDQRKKCADTWRAILAPGMNVETPEPVVNNAARHLVIQNFELMSGDRMHYSAGNQYDKLYEAEGSDAALAMMEWGYERDMRRLIEPLLDFTRRGLEFHQAGFKVMDVCRYYWQTRDAMAVRELRPRWEKEARRLVEGRTGAHGLFPPEQYCGDIPTPVQSVNANAKAWRALRDLSAVLAEIGEPSEARHYAQVAAEFRPVVLTAIENSARHDYDVPFVPVALYGDEPAHDPITATHIGSYWNIIIGYTIASGIFPAGSEEETWIPHYLERHGGLSMGMLRAGGGAFTFWNSADRINPLYGTRYALDALRRDDPDRALVSFYGMLAQGFTPNTFVSGEGCSLRPVDARGRFFYCPPNSAANAHFLSMLRALLVQDSNPNDQGKPDTLRLLFATPRRWLEEGQTIKVERAPTVFGPVSVIMHSRLSQGEIVAEVNLPQRQRPAQTLLRARVPDGWKVESARAAGRLIEADERGTVDISALRGTASIQFRVRKI